MKQSAIFIIFLSVLISGCAKENQHCISDLDIVSVNTPSSGTISSGITSSIECYGPNLCYSFSHVEIKKMSEWIYELRVKANIPCKPTHCLQAIYNANPIVKINIEVAGTYFLKFYNRNLLFKTDTVIIN